MIPHGTFQMVQWLRLHPPNAGGPGLIPDQEIRSYMLQLRILTLQLKSLNATTKTWWSLSQKNK